MSFVAQLAAPISHRTRENGPGGCCLYSIITKSHPPLAGAVPGAFILWHFQPTDHPPYLVARASPDQNVELALIDNLPFLKLSLR